MHNPDLPQTILIAFLALVFLRHAWNNLRMASTPNSTGAAAISSLKLTPLVGGCCGALACLLSPWPGLAEFWWLPLLADIGAAPYMLIALAGAFGASTRSANPNPTALERAASGCLLGMAAGDALGLACEGLSKSRQAKMFPSLQRPGFLFGRGMCSDDTEHACMTAQALLGANGDPQRFAQALGFKLRWWLCGLPAGIGLATLRSIIKLWLGFSPARSGVVSAGNGPAMRAPVIGVCHGGDLERMRGLVAASTRITHRDARAEEGALAVALAAHLASSRTTPVTPDGYCAALEALLGTSSETMLAVRAAADSVTRGESAAVFAASIGCGQGVSGYMLHTVPVVLHVWLNHQQDFGAGVCEIVRLGGDTDTTAAILGGIIGARTGREGIPAQWLDDLAECPRSPAFIAALGARAAYAAENGVVEPEIPLFVPALVPRNLVFMLVVLLHGVRRMLPPY